MRDTLVMVAILIGILWGLSTFKDMRSSDARLGSNSAGSSAAAKNRRAGNKFNKGADSERSGHQHHHAVESFGEGQGSAVDVAEAEKLPSIYSRKEQLSPSSVKRPGRLKQLIPGVPLQALLDPNSIRYLPLVPVDNSPAMRVYLWCMEVKKKGLEYAGNRECQRIENGNASNDIVMREVVRN